MTECNSTWPYILTGLVSCVSNSSSSVPYLIYTRVRYSMDSSIILYAEMNRKKKKKINLVYLVSIFFKNKGIKEKILFYFCTDFF